MSDNAKRHAAGWLPAAVMVLLSGWVTTHVTDTIDAALHASREVPHLRSDLAATNVRVTDIEDQLGDMDDKLSRILILMAER